MMQVLTPSSRYLTKLYTIASIIALCLLVVGILIAAYISFVLGQTGLATSILKGFIVFDLLWYLPSWGLTKVYFNSLRYEISEDMVIIYAGFWTRSVKRVPFQYMVALDAHWDILDRWLEIGTLAIHVTYPGDDQRIEEHLVGLSDVNNMYRLVMGRLQRYQYEPLTYASSV
jgi:membrane protein YdbS with pleckstrin-like domain